jgi:IS1 family transposase
VCGEKEEQGVAYICVASGSGEIVAYEWGKRELKTTQKLRKRIRGLGISYDRIGTDDKDSFLSAFGEDNHDMGKEHRVGIEGNDCRIRRAFGRTCCFSKKLRNHWKAFDMAFFYINYDFI